MRIEQLTIHNIASIADATIDFGCDALRDEPLFLITGPTGAGKTTILDAICLALYGRTPRMERQEGREKYSPTAGEEPTVATNDNRQLMRLGTGECFAELLFSVGMVTYKAQWVVRRAHRRPDGALQPPEHTLQNMATGEVTKRHADRAIQDVTGLRYEQFCRTAMLAQGEFTKFLQSNAADKSDILEKLTDTGIYSRIGQKIYALTQERKAALDAIALQMEATVVLTDEERLRLAREADEQAGRATLLGRQTEVLTACREWATRAAQIERRQQDVARQLAATQATMAGEAWQEELRWVADYGSTAEARLWLAEQRQLLRQAADEERARQRLMAEYEALMGGTAAGQQQAAGGGDESPAQMQADSMEQLGQRIEQLTRQKTDVERAQTACQLLLTAAQTAQQAAQEWRTCQSRLDEIGRQLPQAVSEHAVRQEESRHWQQAYDKASMALTAWAREARALLRVGDVCPVCGQRISQPVADEPFASALQPVQQGRQQSAERLRMAAERLGALRQEEKEVKLQAERLGRQAAQAQAAADRQRTLATQACGQCGIVLTDEASALQALGSMATAVQAETAQAFRLQRLLAGSQLQALRLRAAALGQQVEQFLQQVHMSRQRLEQLAACRQADIDRLTRQHEQVQHTLVMLQGEARQLADQAAAHAAARPATMPADGWQAIDQQIAQCKAGQHSALATEGALRQQLRTDDERRRQRAALAARHEQAGQEYARWSIFCNMFGDKEGKRFRNIAQSLVLGHLLDMANRYLRCFTNRYTLTHSPGTLAILVSDGSRAAMPQSASILSGGESFMVSLSLALALAQMSTSMGAEEAAGGTDTLFIDEGFGTLDSESLTSVMDTLERLHQIGGRRVGIISHVEELQERIGAQITVERGGGSSPAKVTVGSILE